MIGQTISRYHVLQKIGAGGQGEVYLAEDIRLKRKVALKMLPPEFAADPDRLARFEREARAAAALNHPHIAAVYELGAVEEARFIVQEYLEGRTLRELLGGGKLPLKRALELSLEIAEALAAAHAAGIVHRDLKPENVLVMEDGHAKVLDFGLAKLTGPLGVTQASDSTVSEPTTRTTEGQLLGTVGYMAPEQVEGQQVDPRADLFSFGCVLYEMATGKPPFAGRSALETLHRILDEEPAPIRDLPVPKLQWILEKCLAKDCAERYQHAADLVVDLRRLRRDVESGAAYATELTSKVSAPARLMRLAIPLPASALLALGERPALALAPDGMCLVYAAKHNDTTQFYVRAMDGLEPTLLAGTEGGTGPFFSPDGHRVGFLAGGKLKVVSLSGGVPLTLCDAAESRGASWGPDDRIIFSPAQAGGLWRISAAGGKPEILTSPDLAHGEVTHRWPEILPGGQMVLFTIGTAGSASYDDARIAVLSLQTGERRILVDGGSHARYVPTGHLVFLRAATLLAIPLDLTRLEVTGPSVPLLEGVLTETTGAAQWTFSANGSLVYIPGGVRVADRSLLWVNRKGEARSLPLAANKFEEPRLSPDGRRVAVSIRGASNDVWVYEISRGTLTRLTFQADNFSPIWTPDGKRVTFSSNRNGPSNIFWAPADGSAAAKRLLQSEFDQVASSWSPDGRMLAYTEYRTDTGADIWVLSIKGERRPRPFLRTPFNEWGAMFSPDGRWLAYTSDESGRAEIYVQRVPGSGRKWQISVEGGTEPLWARDGRSLFYRQGDNLSAVAVTTKPEFRAAKPRLVFAGQYIAGTAAYLPNYEVARDGKRFLMIKQSKEQASARELHLVLDWFVEIAGATQPPH